MDTKWHFLYGSYCVGFFYHIIRHSHVEPGERHEGIVDGIVFESLVKLVVFLILGFYICYFMFDGIGDLFAKAWNNPETKQLFFQSTTINGLDWIWLMILSMCAIILLPRQFHIGVVENISASHIKKATWLFPLYLLLINLFVIPVAIAGKLNLGVTSPTDYYLLSLPLSTGNEFLALLVFLGGFSAATGMVIVETTALSIMVSNYLVMPNLLNYLQKRELNITSVSSWLLNVRRITILTILIFAHFYITTVGAKTPLVSIGLISFTAVAQFAPAVFGGLYIKSITQKGVVAGLLTGLVIWLFTLPFPSLISAGFFSSEMLENGYFGISFLKPYALFGLEGWNQISHAAFWSLTLNVFVTTVVSLYTRQDQTEVQQANLFVNFYKYYQTGLDHNIQKKEANTEDLMFLLKRFLGEERASDLVEQFNRIQKTNLMISGKANTEFINFTEKHIAGAIGASSAKILIDSIAKEEPIGFEEMLSILDQTQQILKYSSALEQKSIELQRTTEELQSANAKLQTFDRLKDDFISTVTHELRTPLTSIRSISKILLDDKAMNTEQRQHFVRIIATESERLARLINQVLDTHQLDTDGINWNFDVLNIVDIAHIAMSNLEPIMQEKNIQFKLYTSAPELFIKGDKDQLIQLITNLLGNAIKFCNANAGEIEMNLTLKKNGQISLTVKDNGLGIPKEKQRLIFDKFTQLHNDKSGKPSGSGLGLYISQNIAKAHNSTILVSSPSGGGAIFTVSFTEYTEIITPVQSIKFHNTHSSSL